MACVCVGGCACAYAVISGDDDERVDVRQRVGEGEVGDRRPVERRAGEQQRRGEREEAEEEHRPHHAAHEVERAGAQLAALVETEERDGERERLVRERLGDLDALLAQLLDLELLVRVRRVVVPGVGAEAASERVAIAPNCAELRRNCAARRTTSTLRRGRRRPRT